MHRERLRDVPPKRRSINANTERSCINKSIDLVVGYCAPININQNPTWIDGASRQRHRRSKDVSNSHAMPHWAAVVGAALPAPRGVCFLPISIGALRILLCVAALAGFDTTVTLIKNVPIFAHIPKFALPLDPCDNPCTYQCLTHRIKRSPRHT